MSESEFIKKLEEKQRLKRQELELQFANCAQIILDKFKTDLKEFDYLKGQQRQFRLKEFKSTMFKWFLESSDIINFMPKDYQENYTQELIDLFDSE